ncbi:hypothetical protein [Photobacterium damselae]|uniref:hypothetical protein n=1 Tax=Photobacterium damselae TaxID=38293 RepID=UPI001F35962C|nr:hypothetical protein [Photobacterium damselae]UKA04775.1 hypothetical protein IHC89_21270 [Photobacterium damselae subsp. damselae]
MTTQAIKLKKISDNLWTAPNTKYLSEIKISKGAYGYRIHATENECSFEVCGELRTQKEVKNWLSNYDEIHEAHIAEELEEEQARLEELNNRRAAEDKFLEQYTKTVTDFSPVVGFSQAKLVNRSKQNNLGVGIYQANQPMNCVEDKYWDRNRWVTPQNWSIGKIYICEVLTLSTELYDTLVVNLMSGEICKECGITNEMGGSESSYEIDKDKYPQNTFFYKATEEEFNAWRAESWTIVAAITAPKRQPFYIDTQGSNVARYVAFPA